MRLDKFISNTLFCSRTDAKKLIHKKEITVNDLIITTESFNVNPEQDKIAYQKQIIIYEKYHYYMLNKPAGYITSTKDSNLTVMSLIKEFPKLPLSCVGRLDKDTEGLLLITDNGDLIHHLTSPKKHIPKTYYVEVKKDLSLDDITKLETGLDLGDFVTKAAQVTTIGNHTIYLTIYEGKYHQIKRMMLALNNEVCYLKRLKVGPITLDETLKKGEYRPLTKEEIDLLLNN